MSILKIIKERRSVREFQEKEIPEEIVDKLIEALIWAPSAGNLQSRKFYFVFDQKIKEKLVEAALGQDFIAQAPLVVVGCTNAEISWRYGDRGKNLYSICDVSTSIENMMLFAHEQGLGTCLEGSTELILNDGTIEKISNFVEKRITLRNKSLEIGTSNGDKVLSWRKFSPTFVNVLAVEKLPKIKKILEIKTQSGAVLRVTPDHKILIDTIDGPKLVRADEIKVGDYVYSPRKIDIKNNKFSIKNFLKEHKIFDQFNRKNFEKIKNVLLTPDLMYLVGLISAEGSLGEKDNNRISFSNSEKELIKIFCKKYKKLFPNKKIQITKRENQNLLLRVNNHLLAKSIKCLRIKDDPKIIFRMDEKLIQSYIRGVFDGDGSASICYDEKKGYVIRIKISSSQKIFTERIKLLLKRIGIVSSLSSWEAKGFSNTRMFDVLINNEFDILTFIKKVGSYRPTNLRKFKWMRNFYLQNKNKGHAAFMLAPLICGRLVKRIRKRHNIPANKIAPYTSYLTNREGCRERTRKDIFEKFYKSLMKRCRDKELQILKEMISPKFHLDKIVEIKVKNPFNQDVFDITTFDTHLFIPNGDFVVSNCWVGAFDEREVSKILNLPKPSTRAKLGAGPVPHRNKVSGAGNLRPIAIVPVGYPAEKPSPPPRISKKGAVEFLK